MVRQDMSPNPILHGALNVCRISGLLLLSVVGVVGCNQGQQAYNGPPRTYGVQVGYRFAE